MKLVVNNQCNQLTREKSEAGKRTLTSMDHVVPSPVIQMFFSYVTHTAANCRKVNVKRGSMGYMRRCSGQWWGDKWMKMAKHQRTIPTSTR